MQISNLLGIPPEQSSGLSEIQQTRVVEQVKGRSENIHMESIVYMQPIESTLLRKYKNVALFGDGNEDPMKLQYLDSGRRDYLELHIYRPANQHSVL